MMYLRLICISYMILYFIIIIIYFLVRRIQICSWKYLVYKNNNYVLNTTTPRVNNNNNNIKTQKNCSGDNTIYYIITIIIIIIIMDVVPRQSAEAAAQKRHYFVCSYMYILSYKMYIYTAFTIFSKTRPWYTVRVTTTAIGSCKFVNFGARSRSHASKDADAVVANLAVSFPRAAATVQIK